ncbi:hypothetical protein COW36_24640 [bacterium (Candidatus Blackallbacteria) CG17_big_fil_post_rev_8_21_14_2_50_48_46]|uniref:Trigger factor C-terminal domain-containing protein n=1 Tax=bacterium (Candidatus Blackallbacteria) CG17_big_fil_post_rev_8_21_14_2_50_48_46 TaxID=2014261 RepID=A0A2M7FX72_9BACT|nr:MAG: hypothetical protein COW64_19580 [bacterium (Candidatus Blackallbacteria) CG18_big_fil_WC_8_21_14_2_50_49_26]PIW13857.1 MAG: hypothetical protein COW36_24640 [bacterium (Candidatus Blackallbacteria) CG17_big_fil_post_rev_8_21_14_2_50_48_46]PIW45083.1 MAG: hypothetical protein COW20_22270 [bacterium (Candidatus Blackallbacteria) CG13_big_fil_rev_8_21_14_2_50_49_14]
MSSVAVLEESPGHYRLYFALPTDLPPQDVQNWLALELDAFLIQKGRQLWDLPQIESQDDRGVSVLARVFPPVYLPELSLTLELPPVQQVTEELLQSHLIELQYALAQAEEVMRPVAQGDRICFDFYAEVAGIPLPGACQSYAGRVRNDLIAPGFFQNLVGLKPGESHQFQWDLPGASGANCHVYLQKVEALALPPLDDAFPSLSGLGVDWAAAFSNLQAQLSERYQAQWQQFVRRGLLYSLAELAQIEIPEDLFIAQQLARWNREEGAALAAWSLSQGERDRAFELWRQQPENFEQDYADLRLALVVREVVQQEALEIRAEELALLLKPFAERFEMTLAEIHAALTETGALQSLLDQALQEKVVDLLVQRACLTREGKRVVQAGQSLLA